MTSNFKTALTAGFQTLRARGYFAEQNWQCCQSCGVAAIPDEYTDYVFYHSQDAEFIAEDNAVRVSWQGDGNEIAKVFRDAGLEVEWDGSKQRRIPRQGRHASDPLSTRGPDRKPLKLEDQGIDKHLACQRRDDIEGASSSGHLQSLDSCQSQEFRRLRARCVETKSAHGL